MPKSVNKVILIGHLGKDPEIKYTPNGTAVAKFSLATNEKFKDKSGEWQERTEWHNLVAWQRKAEIIGEYTRRGGKLYIEGRLETSSWEDKESGHTRYRTEIIVTDIVLLGDSQREGSSVAPTPGRYSFDQNGGGNWRASEPEPVYAGDSEDIPF